MFFLLWGFSSLMKSRLVARDDLEDKRMAQKKEKKGVEKYKKKGEFHLLEANNLFHYS